MERIGQHWDLSSTETSPLTGPTLLVAGRQDSTVGFAGTVQAAEWFPNATLAVLDQAGHALPHEQPALLGALVLQWLDRVEHHSR